MEVINIIELVLIRRNMLMNVDELKTLKRIGTNISNDYIVLCKVKLGSKDKKDGRSEGDGCLIS